ncbi:hypothetical protein ABZ635_20730 [Nocardiopsis sp. NPDC007018]
MFDMITDAAERAVVHARDEGALVMPPAADAVPAASAQGAP